MSEQQTAPHNPPGEHELNARRLLCPLPVIRTQNALKALPVGALLRVYCTDPGTLNDIPTWCRLNGHRVREQYNDGREQMFLIEKSAGTASGIGIGTGSGSGSDR